MSLVGRVIIVASVLVFGFSSCAPFKVTGVKPAAQAQAAASDSAKSAAQCSRTAQESVGKFLAGLMEAIWKSSLVLLRSVFPPDMNLLQAFSDKNDGGEVVKAIMQYSKEQMGDQVAPEYDPGAVVIDTENPLVKLVTVRRHIDHTSYKTGKTEELDEERQFMVMFDSPDRNCIIWIRAIDPAWRRISESQTTGSRFILNYFYPPSQQTSGISLRVSVIMTDNLESSLGVDALAPARQCLCHKDSLMS